MAIEIDDRRLRASMRKVLRELKRKSPVYGKAAKHMRDYVRATITMQGRKRKYAPLGKWQSAKTGRRKALITLRPNIKSRYDNTKGEVYYNQTQSGWHIDMHHTGFTSPAVVGKRMVVPSRGGGVLAAFHNRKASKIPAREVWPTQAEVNKEVGIIFKDWVEKNVRTNWR